MHVYYMDAISLLPDVYFLYRYLFFMQATLLSLAHSLTLVSVFRALYIGQDLERY